MSTREPKPQEVLTAHNLCIAQANKNPAHQFIVNGCPTCRADVVRLVDAPPSERVPEVPNGALDWLYGQQAKYKQSVVLAGIVAAVEYCAAQNRRPDA